uniref:Lipoprotein n=1 Tax=Candidatus Kentrum sp. TUN TaxID=2126343 RepID=A0A451A999_9GAMM|nr:MAG: hypothetical protein BECKTUN1418F_GA0071002_10856 [Candidatus Kentron sp. TUN]VFK62603.1 MAG: hypothetical protein BECKTUN1418E_GA0071001_10836 [Candidatus Kentron sp. TUN]
MALVKLRSMNLDSTDGLHPLRSWRWLPLLLILAGCAQFDIETEPDPLPPSEKQRFRDIRCAYKDLPPVSLGAKR